MLFISKSIFPFPEVNDKDLWYRTELAYTDNPKDFFSADQKEMVVNFFFTYLSNSNCCILF